MDGISILKKIIEEEGSCSWATPTICAKCPIGLSAKETFHVSCVEALNVDKLSEEAEADKRYKQAAQEKLADLLIDRIIEGN